MSFEKEYWDKNYSEPETMDCISNAKEHAKYLKSFFELEMIDISSIIDFGFGHGYLFQKVMKEFIPYRAMGIEPSKYIFDKTSKRKLIPVDSTKLKLYHESLETWCLRENSKKLQFDLALCTSVLQYIENSSLEKIVSVVSKRVKYLYLTVPTDIELKRQVEDLDFDDTYALKRSRNFYRKILSKHFTNISSKIWESKFHFNEENTNFTDLLYRS